MRSPVQSSVEWLLCRATADVRLDAATDRFRCFPVIASVYNASHFTELNLNAVDRYSCTSIAPLVASRDDRLAASRGPGRDPEVAIPRSRLRLWRRLVRERAADADAHDEFRQPGTGTR